MTVKATFGELVQSWGKYLATGGFVIAAIAGMFCVFSSPPPASANGWLIIGVGVIALGGVLHAIPVAFRGISDLRQLFRRRRQPKPLSFLNRN